ncbi:uncharacterized protein [Henckelia pumila]|uniref:uncharacterized protein n=1 Tax=Henckelia pumila TaxID=405737 RepID=UPI003C6E38FF
MGINLNLRGVNSGWKTEGDEARRPISPNLTPPNFFQRLGERLRCTLKRIWRKICSVPISLWKCLKGVFHRIRSLFYLSQPRKSADPPLLPVENPAPKPSDHPPLEQSLLVSNEQNHQEDSSETYKNHATISIPSFGSHVLDSHSTTGSIIDTVLLVTDSAADTTQENASRKINVSYAVHQETGIYYSEAAGSRIDTADSASAIVQENVSQKNEYSCAADKESEGEKVIETAVVVEQARWIMHYSSRHRILLVGEGDFSFSHSLAKAFGCASKMVATSLDSIAFLKKNYSMAPWNIGQLKKRGCIVMHEIDATTIATHHQLKHMTFDRIIYNFPFAGFFKGLSRDSSLRIHRRLVSLFLKNAKGMIDEDGEIHISHKTNSYHNEWNLVSMASSHRLRLIEEVAFRLSDYPGYNTKRGFGGDENFNCYPSNTFKFGLKSVGH